MFFVFGLYLSISSAKAQENYIVNVFPNRLNVSFETVVMDNESDLGFLGTGFEVLNVSKKITSLYLGLHSYSAITGDRPGLITLGMNAGIKVPIVKKKPVFVDAGFFIGGGGGGGADDGGGLILRPHINLEKQFGVLGLKVGFSQVNFPTGEIKGNQLNFGFTLNGFSYLKASESFKKAKSNITLNFNRLNFGIVSTYYFGLTEDSISNSKSDATNRRVGLVGAQLEYEITDNLYGIGKINGALLGGVDGYMSIFLGMGGVLPIVKNRLNLESRILFGPTGGGTVESGGGATLQFEAGASLFFDKDYYIKTMLGKTKSPWGDLNTNHLEIVMGKSFGKMQPKLLHDDREFIVSKENLIENHISFSVYNRTYFSPDNVLDKNSNLYLSSFNSLCFEVQKFIGSKFTINAATVWAYEGDYGAYAEGLIGLGFHQPIFSKWKINTKAFLGAAGGGGIDVGNGLIFQYSGGIERAMGEKLKLLVNAGKFVPIKGNFNPISLDLGLSLDLHQLFLKN